MANIFIIAGIISTIYFLIKFAEMRMVDKESKPLKFLVRDALLVYFSVLAGNFVAEQLKPIMDEGEDVLKATTSVFTDNPSF